MSLHDERWMREALSEAARASELGDVPVGCVIVSAKGEPLGRGRNEREHHQDPTAHAEMVALRAAARTLGQWRLEATTLYVTLEPCAMCAGALVNARIGRLVYAAADAKAGAIESRYSIGVDDRLNHRFDVTGGVLAEEAAAQLRSFFGELRALGKK